MGNFVVLEGIMAITETKQKSAEARVRPTGKVRPDAFFTETQVCRLQELMQRVQAVQKPPEEVLPETEYQELETLIQEELRASARRAASLLPPLAP